MAPSETSSRSRLKWVVRLLLGLLVLAALLWRLDVTRIVHELKTVSLPIVVAAVVLYCAGQWLSAFKWQRLLNAVLYERGEWISLAECCRLYWMGMFWNLWMPSSVGGDAIRTLMAPPQIGRALVASSILVERVTGVIALLGIALCGLLFNSLNHDQSARAIRIITMTVVVIGVVAGIFLVLRIIGARGAEKLPDNPILKKWNSVQRALDLYRDRVRRGALGLAMVLSFIFQASQVVLNILLAHAVGLDIPAATFWWLAPLLSLAALLPVGIGGLGVREAAAVALLGGGAVMTATGSTTSLQTVVAWSLLWQVTVWLSSLPGILMKRSTAQQQAAVKP